MKYVLLSGLFFLVMIFGGCTPKLYLGELSEKFSTPTSLAKNVGKIKPCLVYDSEVTIWLTDERGRDTNRKIAFGESIKDVGNQYGDSFYQTLTIPLEDVIFHEECRYIIYPEIQTVSYSTSDDEKNPRSSLHYILSNRIYKERKFVGEVIVKKEVKFAYNLTGFGLNYFQEMHRHAMAELLQEIWAKSLIFMDGENSG